MGHSEDYIRNKMYELEKQKVEIEKKKVKVLEDIRDVLLAISGTMLGQLAIDCDTPAKGETFNHCKGAVVEEVSKSRRGGQNDDYEERHGTEVLSPL